MTTPYAALIRGINVGGHNVIAMAKLRGFFEDAGCEDVATYIQSGNVVFGATAKLATTLPKKIGGLIAKALGRDAHVSVVVRSGKELDAVIDKNPFHEESVEPKAVHVGFLESAPSAAKIALLDPKRSEVDRFEVHGKHVYLYTAGGIGRSKLGGTFFDKLGTPCTMRNMATVRKLDEMLKSRR